MNRIETRKLAELSKTNETAQNIFTVLSLRERASKFTNLASFRHSLKKEFAVDLERKDYDAFWVALQRIGIGKVIRSAQKVPIRFDWQGWDSQSVGQAALDPSKHPVQAHFRNRKPPARVTKPQVAEPRNSIVAAAVQPGLKTVSAEKVFAVFMTQNSEAIKLELSKGLTRKDRDALIGLLNDLPTSAAS